MKQPTADDTGALGCADLLYGSYPMANVTEHDPLTVESAESRPSPERPIRVGCAGWAIPREAARCFDSEGHQLERYARVLNCCEINSTFYRPHKEATWARWRQLVPDGFLFSVKMPRAITHEGALNCNPEALLSFLRQVGTLNEKLGAVLIQLPPGLEFAQARTTAFLSMLRENYSGDVAWEPRHRSWFSDGADTLLGQFGIARVAADPAVVCSASQPGGFTDFTYFRLHGSPRRYYSEYSETFLDTLVSRLAILGRAARTWCIFDNTAAGFATPNALHLMAKLRQVDNEEL
jgi:uncharacterized protein YecE (DUF72 family)